MVGTMVAWLGPTVEGELSTRRHNFDELIQTR